MPLSSSVSIASLAPPSPPAFHLKTAREPMLWAAVAYSLGIIAGFYVWRPILWWMAAGVGFAAAGAYFARRRSWLGWWLAVGALFLAGAFHIQARGTSSGIQPGIQYYADHRDLQITAHVIRDGRLQQAGFNEIRQTIDVETEAVQTEEVQTDAGTGVPIRAGIRLSIYSPAPNSPMPAAFADDNVESSTMPVFHYGDRIHFTAKLRTPRNFHNPGAFDYRGYLADHDIAALGSTKFENIEVLPGFSGSRISSWRSRLHRAVVAKVHELWPVREAALIDAMVI